MAKAVRTSTAQVKKEKPAVAVSTPAKPSRILITQSRPEGDKSPYFDLAKKFDLELDFHPFIRVEGLSGKEFRRQRVDLNDYTAIVFTSRLAVDHFFRIMEEMKVKVSQELKYFCITEAVALYLQKFILYRKRKVFFSADGSTQGLLDVIGKHKNEKYIVPMTDSTKKDIPVFMTKYKIPFAEASLYRTVSNDLAPVLDQQTYDMIVFFSPFSIQALMEYNDAYLQNGTVIGAFGPTTTKAAEDAGLRLDIKAPAPQAPSMVSAMEQFLAAQAQAAPVKKKAVKK
ncbi:MAG: uroporphyrinogen-III synthase [Sphingobacteriales bacterium]|nr:MAG: uroporphyrinogen-III synthase [Sphingobacteriales bacterium]